MAETAETTPLERAAWVLEVWLNDQIKAGKCCITWGNVIEFDAEAAVREILQAIREPSDEMEDAAYEIDPIAQFDVGPRDTWQAMIDAALAESTDHG